VGKIDGIADEMRQGQQSNKGNGLTVLQYQHRFIELC